MPKFVILPPALIVVDSRRADNERSAAHAETDNRKIEKQYPTMDIVASVVKKSDWQVDLVCSGQFVQFFCGVIVNLEFHLAHVVFENATLRSMN